MTITIIMLLMMWQICLIHSSIYLLSGSFTKLSEDYLIGLRNRLSDEGIHMPLMMMLMLMMMVMVMIVMLMMMMMI